MTFRAYLVDDEPLAISRLTRLLLATGRYEIAGSTVDPEEALAYLSREKPDVVFLDIQMPGMNGFELLSRLADQPPVVFTTAFDQYALKAFEVNSIDYLLKPVEPQQLERATKKLERLGGVARPDWMKQPGFRSVLDELAALVRSPHVERVASRAGERVHLIPVDAITHFFARDKLTYAAAGGKAHAVDYTIGELEQKLDPRRFVRIHRAVLVNLDWVQEVDAWFSGSLRLRLKDEKHTELTVARDRARVVKARLEI